MTYDNWKTTNPDDRFLQSSECDCCGRRRRTAFVLAFGNLETFACAECRGHEGPFCAECGEPEGTCECEDI
jgi:hypothetical protein